MTTTLQDSVRENYGAVAASALTGAEAGVRAVAEAFGYSAEELDSIPAGANMGLSCGNPTATANLRPGETVVDLGCGGGLDVFLAARKVGPTGKAIGIDMTPAMLERARVNAAMGGPNGTPLTNVEFHHATIDALPLEDASVDCIISNCVINLAPDKPAVFREIARVLKPGGRLAVSDIALKKPLPEAIKDDVGAYVGCIAGAIPIEQFQTGLADAGFSEVKVVDDRSDLNAYASVDGQGACCSPSAGDAGAGGLAILDEGCCSPAEQDASADPTLHARLAKLLAEHDINDYAASVKVYAVKP
ncbi:arsenite methyltransferase [Alienimonas chondri]|uniref:Arsenite methyltransferase n=1 Tax=Alienimonas chondri TaxID=2681879 RepID=A0ABX1VHZ0_9PLAN|nr:arsenite methyltransferase [Alienimonas chondri]NNJ27701.1 Ubiquinone/menaquinone biosynthesis C-methyltransferase UbiE [Alienimonas chondri]